RRHPASRDRNASRRRGAADGARRVPGGPGSCTPRPRSCARAGGARTYRAILPARPTSRTRSHPIAPRRPMDGSPWPQSALAPDGPAARAILEIGWILTGLSVFVVLLVAAALLIAV